jgi:hypothetical protein
MRGAPGSCDDGAPQNLPRLTCGELHVGTVGRPERLKRVFSNRQTAQNYSGGFSKQHRRWKFYIALFSPIWAWNAIQPIPSRPSRGSQQGRSISKQPRLRPIQLQRRPKSKRDLVQVKTPGDLDEAKGEISKEVSRNEKSVDARSISEQAPEVVMMFDDPDKCVDYGPEAHSPEVLEAASPLYPVHDETDVSEYEAKLGHELDHGSKQHAQRTCGLRKTTFWLVTVLICVLISTVTIGAVLGIVLSTRENHSGNPKASAM